MDYRECPVLCYMKKSNEPIISKVSINEYTDMVSKNFDYSFTGESCVYPYELPKLPTDFKIMCIVGASGSGKSTLLDKFVKIGYNKKAKIFNEDSIVSNFKTPKDASDRLSAVGLNSLPVWCRPRKVLSTGEGFRADLALNLDSYKAFDEFTSTIDRNVAKSTCKGVKRYVEENKMHNIIFCSCHKDFIPFLEPDIIIDLDEEKVYDCRGECLGETLCYKSMKQTGRTCGTFLGNIII